jgi:hypothetical protein
VQLTNFARLTALVLQLFRLSAAMEPLTRQKSVASQALAVALGRFALLTAPVKPALGGAVTEFSQARRRNASLALTVFLEQVMMNLVLDWKFACLTALAFCRAALFAVMELLIIRPRNVTLA